MRFSSLLSIILTSACGASSGLDLGSAPEEVGRPDSDAGRGPPDAIADAGVDDSDDAGSPHEPDGGVSSFDCTEIDGTWWGTTSGNDPCVQATLEVEAFEECPAFTGEIRLSGTSGVSTRSLEGSYDSFARSFVAHDTAFVRSDPATLWRFCLIDSYALQLAEDGQTLSGTYLSEDCHDEAEVHLSREPPEDGVPVECP